MKGNRDRPAEALCASGNNPATLRFVYNSGLLLTGPHSPGRGVFA